MRTIIQILKAHKAELDQFLNRNALTCGEFPDDPSDEVLRAIENGADVNETDEHGDSCLIMAAKLADHITAEILIRHGALIDYRNHGIYKKRRLH